MQSSLFSILLFGLLASWVAAAPSNIQKRSFKVERVKNANFRGRNGPKELFKAYSKYSMPVPQGLMDALRNPGSASGAAAVADVETKAQGNGKGKGKAGQKGAQGQNNNAAQGTQGTNSSTANAAAAQQNTTAGVGKVANTPETGDIEYLAPVTIGGQTVNLDFDSGSSDLWVFNTQLAAQSTTGHTLFDPTKSTTFKMIQGASFSISYGDGSGAAGNVGTDTVNIGGATVTQQAIELATAVSTSFVQDTQNNGLVGLAFSKLNTVKPQQQKTFFDNVMPSLAEPLFTADLRKNAVGAYEFGRVDTTKFTGQMAWVPVNTTNGFWQFATSGFAVGNANINKTATAQAIADTGTTLMLVSQETANGYYSQVPGAANDAQVGGITVPCNATLPDLLVDVGGVYTARVKGEDINFAQVQGNTCFGGVQPTTSDLQIWGDIFFKSQFVAFNGGNNSLGMAQHV